MKIYSHKGIKPVYVIGDCHGEFKSLFWNLKKGLVIKSEDEDKPHPKEIEWQKRQMERHMPRPIAAHYGQLDDNLFEDSLTALKKPNRYNMGAYCNSVLIITGDCGFGFNKLKYYEDLLTRYNKILSYNGTYVYFIRGNHDDPAYFDGNVINFSNIKAIPDYSIIETAEHNILCIGGGLSIDRTWRKEQEKRINRFSPSNNKKLYWENEMPVFNSDEIKEACKSIKIDCVVTHTAPSFAFPQERIGLDEWAEKDNALINDIKEERIIMDKIFEALRDNGSASLYWAYGHFHMSNIERRSNTIFRALRDNFNPTEISTDIKCFELNEISLKKKMKKSKSKKILKEEIPDMLYDNDDAPFEDHEEQLFDAHAVDDRGFENRNIGIEDVQAGENIAARAVDDRGFGDENIGIEDVQAGENIVARAVDDRGFENRNIGIEDVQAGENIVARPIINRRDLIDELNRFRFTTDYITTTAETNAAILRDAYNGLFTTTATITNGIVNE